MAESKPSTTERDSWGTDFFGTLNTLPPQPVALIAEVLEAMRTEPTFQRARQEMLADLRLAPGATVLDGGCGTGAALPDLLAAAGPTLQVVGVDPTDAFVERARARAQQLGAAAARYETGDIRALPFPEASFDAAFCDKVLLHVGPAAVLAELVRVTRPGGRIGAVEWCPMFVLSTSRPELAHALNDALRRAVYDFLVSANLARHFRAGGLAEVQTRVYLAQAASLEEHPFWRAFLIDQLPLFAHAGLLTEEQAQELAADLQALSGQGVFRASCVVAKAVGTKPAASH